MSRGSFLVLSMKAENTSKKSWCASPFKSSWRNACEGLILIGEMLKNLASFGNLSVIFHYAPTVVFLQENLLQKYLNQSQDQILGSHQKLICLFCSGTHFFITPEQKLN